MLLWPVHSINTVHWNRSWRLRLVIRTLLPRLLLFKYIYILCGIAFCPGQPNGYKCGLGFARLSYEGMSTQSVLTKGSTGQPVNDERAHAVSPFENGVLLG